MVVEHVSCSNVSSNISFLVQRRRESVRIYSVKLFKTGEKSAVKSGEFSNAAAGKDEGDEDENDTDNDDVDDDDDDDDADEGG